MYEPRWINANSLVDNNISLHFMKKKINKDNTLLIMGEGFDNRMCMGLGKLASSPDVQLTIWKIHFNEAPNSTSEQYRDSVRRNLDLFSSLSARCNVVEFELDMWKIEPQERFVAELNAAKFIHDRKEEIEKYDTVVLDISAFPQSIYFPMVDQFCKGAINGKLDFYVLVTENYLIDMHTNAVELGESAHQMQGFMGSAKSASKKITVWFPVLGEVDNISLNKYHDFLITKYDIINEICPVLPLPAEDVNRSNNIIKAYMQTLFDRWSIEKGNFIYAAESNPYQVYRKLHEAAIHYIDVIKPIGECRFVFSTITSKLMGIGALLAAIDLKEHDVSIDFISISNKGYIISKDVEQIAPSKTVCLCLSHKVY